jgi:hypothetical protein
MEKKFYNMAQVFVNGDIFHRDCPPYRPTPTIYSTLDTSQLGLIQDMSGGSLSGSPYLSSSSDTRYRIHNTLFFS